MGKNTYINMRERTMRDLGIRNKDCSKDSDRCAGTYTHHKGGKELSRNRPSDVLNQLVLSRCFVILFSNFLISCEFFCWRELNKSFHVKYVIN